MRIGSLFSGYGGLDMGIQSVLGGDTAWFVEFDKAPSRILAHHWPDVPNYGDVTTVDWSQVEPVDIITGGFPCQDVSHAGRRAGLIRDGEGRTRSGLWGEMLRAVDTIRPALVVAENVRGLLSARADSDMEPCAWCMGDDDSSPMRALGAVLGDLADIGYDAWWYGLRAADVGAAHGRFRVFIFAWPTDAESDTRRLIDRDCGAVDGPRGAAADGVTLLPTPAVNDMGASYTPEQWDAWTAKMQAEHGNGNGHGKSLSIEAQRLLPTPVTTDANTAAPADLNRKSPGLRAIPSLLPTPVSDNSRGLPSSGTDYQSLPNAVVSLLPTPRAQEPGATNDGYGLSLNEAVGASKNGRNQAWGDYGPAIARWETVTGSPAPAPTEPGKSGPRLSAAFVEWLMGLPAGHITDPAIWDGMTPSAARNAALKAGGNGVVPQQAAAAVRAFAQDFEALTGAAA